MSKLQQLIKAAKAATPGPWSYAFPYVRTDRTGWKVANVTSTMGDANLEADNAKFITLANPATILELCALLEKAETLRQAAYDVSVKHGESLAAAQAREAKLRWYLENYRGQVNQYGQETASTALALPTDDSALMERLKEEYKRGYKAGITTGSMT